MNFAVREQEPEEHIGADSPYIIQPEYKSEQVYQELLPKLLLLDDHIH